ncbi:MAG: PTS sugar transporter subunit IIA [Spirochaetales bacterium]|nr:PTS sugar transporter subunit IIA [Spirochaetales bacterium]
MTAKLAEKLARGGVWFGIAGETPADAIGDAVEALRLGAGIDKAALVKATVERETLMSTGLGDGLAIPHPRLPVVSREEDELVALCYLQKPVAWGALDGRDVHAIFLVLSSGTRTHLATLARLGHLAKDRAFRALLEKRAGKDEMLDFIRAAEAEWGGKNAKAEVRDGE